MVRVQQKRASGGQGSRVEIGDDDLRDYIAAMTREMAQMATREGDAHLAKALEVASEVARRARAA